MRKPLNPNICTDVLQNAQKTSLGCSNTAIKFLDLFHQNYCIIIEYNVNSFLAQEIYHNATLSQRFINLHDSDIANIKPHHWTGRF